MLVQSPYDPDTYEDASLAPQRFALAKLMYFSMLCMHLGAEGGERRADRPPDSHREVDVGCEG